ncbi:peptide deformylase [Methylophilaceae bacterium]|jgi:peptide deformylase|nr:peptide deformylase [Methylophilaceae bacterium]|tara:strand:+ start:1292 stop:1786 length:495 start_codon:yes stop_codon:yes gene_type:complete
MTILNILKYPDQRLYTIANEVKVVNSKIKKLISDMAETMYGAPGIGLAATQVDVHQRIIVIDISEDKNNLLVLINPRLLEKRGEETNQEGCLSVPEVFEKVKRAEWIKVSALDENGKKFELEAEGLLAVCIQHEVDHLLGKVFVDYLSNLKKNRIKKKLIKLSK